MIEQYQHKLGVQTPPRKDEPITIPEKWCDFTCSMGNSSHEEPHLYLGGHTKRLNYTIHFFELSIEFYPPKPKKWKGKSIEELHNRRLNTILQKLAISQINQAKIRFCKSCGFRITSDPSTPLCNVCLPIEQQISKSNYQTD
ncbi:MAG: hypothetical protein ACFFG0_09690 [Candidatus Thorarchaeota archaeon]